MSTKEISICDGCGKEIPVLRISFLDYSKTGYYMGEFCIPFGVSDTCNHSYDLCLDCFDKARKNKLVLCRVKCGNKIEPFDPKKHKMSRGKKI